jgi:hypothetical protein
MLAVGRTCEIRVGIRVMRLGRLGTINGADRLAILPLDACHVQTVLTEEKEEMREETRKTKGKTTLKERKKGGRAKILCGLRVQCNYPAACRSEQCFVAPVPISRPHRFARPRAPARFWSFLGPCLFPVLFVLPVGGRDGLQGQGGMRCRGTAAGRLRVALPRNTQRARHRSGSSRG